MVMTSSSPRRAGWLLPALGVSLIFKLVVWLLGPAVQSATAVVVLDAVTTMVVAASLGYLLVQLVAQLRKRLLWRVRRKLILSYVFIGLIPVVLIGAFVLLAGTLALLSASAFVVRSELDDLVDEAAVVADAVAVNLMTGDPDGGSRRRYWQRLLARHPGASLALLGSDDGRRKSAETLGPWGHVEPPQAWPPWAARQAVHTGLLVSDTDAGFDLVARAMLPLDIGAATGVVVDLPVGSDVRRRLFEDAGVQMGSPRSPGALTTAGGFTWVSFVEHTNWDTGETRFLNLEILVSPGQVYQHIFGTQTRIGEVSLGYAFLVALAVVGGLFLVIEATALITGFVLARSITGAIHELFVGTEHVRRGNLGHRIMVQTRDQLGELAESFNAMTRSVKDLLQEAAEKKRLEEELRIARRIQMSLLPRDTITIAGVTVTATCVPAREVGGDYYDFFRLSERRLGVLVADVSGKGTSAAFYMAELKGLMLSLSRIHESPRQLLIEVNRTIAPHIDTRSFITMMYVVLDLDQKTLTYARAGHTPLIYLRAAASPPTAEVHTPSGLVVGLDGFEEQFEELIEEASLEVGDGDVAVLFTDGVSEAMNEEADLFGEDRLGQLLEAHGRLEAPALREQILGGVQAFVGGADQHDDMTLVLLKIDGGAGS